MRPEQSANWRHKSPNCDTHFEKFGIDHCCGGSKPLWVVSVLVGTFGFGICLAMNLAAAIYVSLYGTTPAFPAAFES
jgi:hypothetical protein